MFLLFRALGFRLIGYGRFDDRLRRGKIRIFHKMKNVKLNGANRILICTVQFAKLRFAEAFEEEVLPRQDFGRGIC